MLNGDEKIFALLLSYVEASGILDAETDIQHTTKFAVKSGSHKAGILVYNTGKIHVEGADSNLKKLCLEVKKSIENGTSAPGILLPPEMEGIG